MSRGARVAVALAVVAIGVGAALLWDPTVCISPALRCAGAALCTQVYCSHQYVPLRLAIGVLAVVIGVLIVALPGKDQAVPEASR